MVGRGGGAGGGAGAAPADAPRVRGVLQRVPAVEGVRPADPAGAAARRLGLGAGAGPRRQPRAGARAGPRAGGGWVRARARAPAGRRAGRGGAGRQGGAGLWAGRGRVGGVFLGSRRRRRRPGAGGRPGRWGGGWVIARSRLPVFFPQKVHVLPQTVLYIADAETFSGHEECHEQKKGKTPTHSLPLSRNALRA